MRKLLTVLIGLSLLISLPAWAGSDSCQSEDLFSKLRSRSDVFIDDQAYAVQSGLLFYRFEMDLAVGTKIRFEARTDGRLLWSEHLTLIEEDPDLPVKPLASAETGGTVVEFLSTSPAQRSRLLRESTIYEISVSIFLDGEVSDILSFAALAERSAALQEHMPIPRAISVRTSRPVVEIPSAKCSDVAGLSDAELPATKGACEIYCWDQYDWCQLNCGGAPSSDPCYSACDADLGECLSSCGGCTPSSNTTVSTALVAIQAVNNLSVCVYDPYQGSDYYRQYRKTFKITTTVTTTYADCSQTVTTTISYTYEYCYIMIASGPCPSPIPSSTIAICTF